MKKRVDLGFKHYKMDLVKRLIQNKPGALAGQSPTEKGLAYWGEYVAAVRDVIGCAASLHCACLVYDFISMENHAVDTDWWSDLVTGMGRQVIVKGEYTVPEGPGLGVELNDEILKEHLIIPGYFEPTPEYDKPMVGTHFGIPVDAIKK